MGYPPTTLPSLIAQDLLVAASLNHLQVFSSKVFYVSLYGTVRCSRQHDAFPDGVVGSKIWACLIHMLKHHNVLWNQLETDRYLCCRAFR